MVIGLVAGVALLAPLTLIAMIGWFSGDQRDEFSRRIKTRTAAERRARRRLGLRP